MTAVNSSRPYLVRALYEWLLDNDDVPYLVVSAQLPFVEVPQDFVKDGQITLSIGPTAVQSLSMENEAVSFVARFGGTPRQVYIPIMAIVAVVGKATNQGMVFGLEPSIAVDADKSASTEQNKGASVGSSKKPSKSTEVPPSLRVIK